MAHYLAIELISHHFRWRGFPYRKGNNTLVEGWQLRLPLLAHLSGRGPWVAPPGCAAREIDIQQTESAKECLALEDKLVIDTMEKYTRDYTHPQAWRCIGGGSWAKPDNTRMPWPLQLYVCSIGGAVLALPMTPSEGFSNETSRSVEAYEVEFRLLSHTVGHACGHTMYSGCFGSALLRLWHSPS